MSAERLENKVAVITGAGQGIGRVTALLFARHGAKVVLLDKNESAASSAAHEINAAGKAALSLACDVSKRSEVNAAVERAVSVFGGVHILINNAGVTLTRPFAETSEEDIELLVSVNLKGTIFASQAVIPHMVKAGGGAIVHDASNAGLVGRPWQSVYGATKAGLVSLTKSMALTLADKRIRVNCVCPGSIDTPMLRGALQSSGNFEHNWRKTEMVIPLGRIGDPFDVAYATLYLASDEAKYITGVALPVDGGRTAGIAEVAHVGMAFKE